MAYTEFACRASGSNLNAGTRTGSSTEPGTSASFTYDGTFATNTFTVSSGNPQTDGVAVGDYVQVSDDSLIGRIARVTSVTSTTIVLSATNTVTVNAGTYVKARVGGAWLGPNAAIGFPLSVGSLYLLQNSSSHPVRVNLKNDQTYAVSTGISTGGASGATFEGYTSSYGDGGRFTADGSTNTIVILTINAFAHVKNFIVSNNGASGSNSGCVVTGLATGGVAHDIRGHGFAVGAGGKAHECEAYACNTSNTSLLGGFAVTGAGTVSRSISHDNSTGSNCHGFVITAVGASFFNCIADTNAGSGFILSTSNLERLTLQNCDAYNNTGDGLNTVQQLSSGVAENCNFIKNGAFGVRGYNSTAPMAFHLVNCGFGAGTQVNVSGGTTGASIQATGSVNYASDVTPWVDPANGDFRINLAAAKGAGRGTYTQTASSYTGTIGYSDIGSAQHQDSAGGGYPRGRVVNA